MATAALALGLVAAGYGAPAAPRSVKAQAVGNAIPARRGSMRVACNRPAALRLVRFEDGSARLECGKRTLVRVSVPG
jgi:hypothetical protein